MGGHPETTLDFNDEDDADDGSYEREVSVYAVDEAVSIADVTQHYFKGVANVAMTASYVKTLRVMHCGRLTELRGLDKYAGLKELNVSSNSILTMSGLENLHCLETLNASCNKISQVFNLGHLVKSLRTLNLSHNRIVSLAPLAEIAEFSVLETLDLTDNYVGELDHLRHLSKFGHLRSLAFQKAGDSSKGSNPICDFFNYRDTVKIYVPQLTSFDGEQVGDSGSMVTP